MTDSQDSDASHNRIRVKKKKSRSLKSGDVQLVRGTQQPTAAQSVIAFVESEFFSKSVAGAVQQILLEHATLDAVESPKASSSSRSRRASVSLSGSVVSDALKSSTAVIPEMTRSLSLESLRRSGEIAVPQQQQSPVPTDLRRVAVRNSSPRQQDAAATSSGNSSANVSPRGGSVFMKIKDSIFNTSPRRVAATSSAQKVFSKDPNQVGVCAHFSGQINFHCLRGKGGAGNVYEGDYRGLNVAIKVYNAHFSIDSVDEERDRIVNKIVAIGSLPENRRIVSLFAYRFEPSIHGGYRLVLVMGLMSTNLSSLIAQRRQLYYGTKYKKAPFPERLDQAPFSQEEIASVLMQIVEGVEFLHSHNIMHRDLKPENIMCRRSDFSSPAEIFDHSLSRATSQNGNLSRSSSRSTPPANVNDDGSDKDKNDADDEFSDDSSGNATRLPPPKQYLSTSIDICTGEETKKMSPNIGRCYEMRIGDFDECRVESNNLLRRSSSLSQSSSKPRQKNRFSLHIGTPNFRAPEMVNKGTLTYTNKVDIWAIGMIMYNLLTLEIPFQTPGADQFTIQAALEKGESPLLPPGFIFSDEWSNMMLIYNACVQVDAEKRLSASELLALITKLY